MSDTFLRDQVKFWFDEAKALATERNDLASRLAQVERERDAALAAALSPKAADAGERSP